MSDDKTMAATFGRCYKASFGIGEMSRRDVRTRARGFKFRLPMQTAALVAGDEAPGRELGRHRV